MGDMSDWIEQTHYMGLDVDDDHEDDSVYWTQKDGTETLLQDMSTSHINNCINLLNSGRMGVDDVNNRDWVKTFEQEIIFRKRKELNSKIKKVKNYKEEVEEIDLNKINKNK